MVIHVTPGLPWCPALKTSRLLAPRDSPGRGGDQDTTGLAPTASSYPPAELNTRFFIPASDPTPLDW